MWSEDEMPCSLAAFVIHCEGNISRVFTCIHSNSGYPSPPDSTEIRLPGNENYRSLIRIMFRKRGGEWRQPDRYLLKPWSSDWWADRNIWDSSCRWHVEYWGMFTGSPADGSRQVLTAPGRGSGTGWLYVYHCWVSLLTSRYRPLNAFSTWSIVKEHTAELPEAPLYLQNINKHLNNTDWSIILFWSYINPEKSSL